MRAQHPITPVSATHSRVLSQLGALACERPSAFYEMALRLRSSDVLDAVARLAVPGGRAPGVQDVGRAIDQGMPLDPVATLPVDAHWLSELAALTAVAVTHRTPDLPAAQGLWDWAEQVHAEQLTQHHRDLRAQVAWLLGSHPERLTGWVEQGALSPEIEAELRADLANPWMLDPQAGSPPAWESHLSTILGPRLEPLHVPAGPGSPFDRLTAPHSPAGAGDRSASTGHGDRSVAIILTTYRPDHSLLTAVRSVIAQTWQEWTLLVVDDASGPGYDDVLGQATGLDPRIRLLRTPTNGGTYRARNMALREVGACDYVTFHDTDDWSHPRRLELSIAPLRDDPDLVATTAWSQKATVDLQLTRLGYRGTSRAAAALMVRRDPVLTALGFFDPVRKSADKEFQRRISVAFPGAVSEVTDPVAVVRRGQTSLSSGDHSRGWRHASRRHYAQAYQPWHRRIRQGTAPPMLSDQAERAFWAPPRWLPSPTDTNTDAGEVAVRPHYDVVLAADFSAPEAEHTCGPAIREARRRHARVGLLQLDAPVLISGPEPSTATSIRSRVAKGQAQWVYLDDDVTVGTVHLLDPQLLHPGTDEAATWTAEDVAVTEPSAEQAGTLDAAVVLHRATAMFGADAHWVGRVP